jgi:hypothetical protein
MAPHGATFLAATRSHPIFIGFSPKFIPAAVHDAVRHDARRSAR